MTTNTPCHEIELDPTARYMAQRLSQLPASIRKEVMEAVAEVVELFTATSTVLEAVATDKSQSHDSSEEERRKELEDHIVTLLYFYMHIRTQTARPRYAKLVDLRKQNPLDEARQ